MLLDEVRCTGNELSIEQCPKSSWREHNCGHKEDAGVSCTPLTGTSVISHHTAKNRTQAELTALERELLKSAEAQKPEQMQWRQCHWFCFGTIMGGNKHWSCFYSPLSLTQTVPCGSQAGRAATRAAWRSITAGSGARSATMAGRSWTHRWSAGSWDLSKIPRYWLPDSVTWPWWQTKLHEPYMDPILRVCFLIWAECFKETTKLKSIKLLSSVSQMYTGLSLGRKTLNKCDLAALFTEFLPILLFCWDPCMCYREELILISILPIKVWFF